jgi:hypothetical protein
MHFNLQHRGLNFSVLDYVDNFDATNITYPNVSYKSISNKLFHSFPSLLIGYCVVRFHSRICSVRIVNPLWWVTYLWVNILKRYREMDQIKIEIIESEIFKSSFTGWSHVFRVMESIPQLRNDKKLLSFHNTFIDRSFYTLTSLLLVPIVAC